VLKINGIEKVTGINLDLTDSGLSIGLSLCMRYGVQIHCVLNEAVARLRTEIDRQTSLHILEVKLAAKSLELMN
jgi:uncharacterized alkaline shock family protein YloU